MFLVVLVVRAHDFRRAGAQSLKGGSKNIFLSFKQYRNKK